MSTAKKILLFSVGLILVVGFVAIGLTIYNKGKTSVANTSAQYDNLVAQYDDVEYALYDGGTASGSEVLALCKALARKQDGVTIIVKTGMNKTTGISFKYGTDDYESNITAAETKKADSADYINPAASFTGKVTKDNNNIVTTVTFTQK
jgi:flagellar basal body-associated protein FliL